ncbi:FkbM family methyltransferase [Sphingomonas sp. CJ99]
MQRLALTDIVPDAMEHGPINAKADRLSGVYLGNQVVLTRLWTGHPFMVSTNDMIVAPHLINLGINEPHNSRTLVSLVRQGDVVVDIGANVGYFSILAGWRAYPDGQLWAFEPNPAVFRILSDNITSNAMQWMARRHRVALSDRTGTAALRIFPGYEATSTIRDVPDDFLAHTEAETGRPSHTIDVPMARLDDVMRDVPEIHVLKIDAEGHEPAVIRGAEQLLRRSPSVKIIMEFVPHIMGTNEARSLLQLLRTIGFRIYRIEADEGYTAQDSDDALIGAPFSDLLLVRPAG